jgi:cation diffusion facilitator family transporter
MKNPYPDVKDPFAGMLLRKVMVETLPPDHAENRTRLGILAGWTSAALSAVLALFKGWLGLVTGSMSMIADATNNLTDMASSLVIALGFHWSRKPRDEDHPFGHGRIEAVAALIMAIALILVGAEVARSGLTRLIHPRPVTVPVWVLTATGVTVLVKIWMALFARQLAVISKSKVLEADAWNHTFDIVCTLLVGVALVSSRMGWGAVDGWTAVAVALFILYTGLGYAREAIDSILGQQPEAKEIRSIYDAVVAVEGVMGVHEIMVHQYGDVKMVSFHIEVDAGLTVTAAHDISEIAEDAVEKKLGWRAVAHVDPVDRSHPLFEELNDFIHGHIRAEPGLVDVHDLRADGESAPYRVSFDLVTDMETPRSTYDAVFLNCLKALEESFAGRVSHADIGIEAAVESSPMARKLFELRSAVK